MPLYVFLFILFTLAANAFCTQPHCRRSHSCSGVHWLGRSEFLSVTVKRIAYLSLCVPSTHLDKGMQLIGTAEVSNRFIIFFFTTHQLEKCSTFCTHLVTKPTLRAFSSTSGSQVCFQTTLDSANLFLLHLGQAVRGTA